MLTCGIDVGSLTAQAVLLEQDRIRGARSMRVKPGPVASALEVTQQLFAACGITPDEVRYTVATGYGRQQLQDQGLAQANVSEISCHGIGAHWLMPSVRTIIDIGGQDAKVIRVDEQGEVQDFVMNDKCASGTGRFLEVMCRVLDVELEELGTLALGAGDPVELTSRCSIFCETEVLHYLQRGVTRANLAAGINRAIGERVASLARRLDRHPDVTMTGGVAKNPAVRAELERILDLRMLPCTTDPQTIGALGAAVIAQKMARTGAGARPR